MKPTYNECFIAALTGLLAGDAGGLAEKVVQGGGFNNPSDAREQAAYTLVQAAKAIAEAAVSDAPPKPRAARGFTSKIS